MPSLSKISPDFIKKALQHRCFPVNSVKIFKNAFLTEHLQATDSVFKNLEQPDAFK